MKEKDIAFIIGAQRSGTTYLYHILDQHPQICMAKPVKPEPKFFLNPQNNKLGIEYYLNKFYPERNDSHMLIEKSTSYIEYKIAGLRIKDKFPKAKILVLLRNPVERAISNYFFSKYNGIENRSIEEVFIQNKVPYYDTLNTSVDPFNYISRGEYINYLKNYYAIFESSNIGIFIFEHLINNEIEVKKITDFLEIENFKYPKPNEIFQKVNFSQNKSKVSIKVYDKLYDHFLPFNKKLENYLKIDLSVWN
jgi:hypothetical protein